jgi:alpha-L-rhamnosidase
MIESQMKRALFCACGLLTLTASAVTPPESVNHRDLPIEKVYEAFLNPAAEARPFVRWWWNNNQVEESEILRELDVLKKAGIGGIEINPIASNEDPSESKAKMLPWRSKEWDEILLATCKAAKERGMVVDLIAGSGWPFGGKFLKPEEQIMRLSVRNKAVHGGEKIRLNLDELIGKKPAELYFVKVYPKDLSSSDQVRDVTSTVGDDRVLSIDLSKGDYVISCGVIERGFCNVTFGVPGADGPAMDHMQESVTRAYLDRLRGVEQTWGEPLSKYVRAVFCDSIETMEANWTHDMSATFLKRKGYDINPWLPFVIDYEELEVTPEFREKIQRVRYDWSEHMVSMFLKNFTAEYSKFCHDHGLLSRYQAYGLPWLMGLAEGYMIPDIPESNNWLYSQNVIDPMEPPHFTWNQKHGYMIWSKYAASAAHMRGKKIVSCEAMTNTKKVFHTTLATIKQADDMNFITGITHSVLHGYNYVPPDVPFPGWIRFGTYFSEHNSWWPYFSHWVNYNARLSSVLQETRPVVEVAILGKTADHWSATGLLRDPIHLDPEYLHRLWEPLSQLGIGCDYLHEAAIQTAEAKNGQLKIGPMAYKVLFVTDAVSLAPVTADVIRRFSECGGKVVFVNRVPDRGQGFVDAQDNDIKVSSAIKASIDAGAVTMQGPPNGSDLNQLREWLARVVSKISYKSELSIRSPLDAVYSLHHRSSDADVFFITNTHRKDSARSRVDFAIGESGLWRWDPETGERKPYELAYDAKGFEIDLHPLESILLVTGTKGESASKVSKPSISRQSFTISTPWLIRFEPVNSGKKFEQQVASLFDFTASTDPQVSNFAGTATYQTSFNLDVTDYTQLSIGQDNDFISEVELNGKKLGVIWYGSRPFELGDALRKGENRLIIRYTTTLWNAMDKKELQPSGLMGPVILR